MQYSNLQTYANAGYPDMSIPPSKKNEEWCMAYAKAAYYDFNTAFPKGVFSSNSGNYEKNRLYALGKQPISPYQKLLGVDTQTNDTWINIDWSVRPIASKFRDIAISRLMQQEYQIVATPIDPSAKSFLDKAYAEAKAKIAVRQMMLQTNPELANHPMNAKQKGDPEDMEELDMRVQFGEQFSRSTDAELAIQLAMYENKSKRMRREWFEDWFDYGVAGYFEWLGEDNKPKARRVDVNSVITNYCRKADFSDMIHCGEIIDVSLVDLACLTDEKGNRKYNEKQLEELAASVAGKWGNPTALGAVSSMYFKPYDKFKVKVVQIYFYSYDDLYYNEYTNGDGNPRMEVKYNPKSRSGKLSYKSKRIKCVYKCNWVIGTDYAYETGLVKDQKRAVDPKKKAETSLPYKFQAYNFYEMRASSMMDRMVPIIDDYQLTVYRLQNFKARMVPSGWWIDLDALEGVALTKGGADMAPMDLITMFMQTGIMVGRSQDVMGNNQNYKPIIPVDNNAAAEMAGLYQDLAFSIAQLQGIVGMNEVTDGSTPNAKNLNSTNEAANLSTNNALYGITFCEHQLYESLASDMMIRTQQGVKKGGVAGYAPALNSNLLKYIQVSPDLALHDYGIMLDEKTTDDQKNLILQLMSGDIANGHLDTGDALYVMTIYNAKQAIQVLSYKVRQSKILAQKSEMAKINANNQGSAQAAQVAHALKMQEMDVEWKHKTDFMLLQHDLQGQMLEMTNNSKERSASMQAQAKVASTVIQAQAKNEQPQQIKPE